MSSTGTQVIVSVENGNSDEKKTVIKSTDVGSNLQSITLQFQKKSIANDISNQSALNKHVSKLAKTVGHVECCQQTIEEYLLTYMFYWIFIDMVSNIYPNTTVFGSFVLYEFSGENLKGTFNDVDICLNIRVTPKLLKNIICLFNREINLRFPDQIKNFESRVNKSGYCLYKPTFKFIFGINNVEIILKFDIVEQICFNDFYFLPISQGHCLELKLDSGYYVIKIHEYFSRQFHLFPTLKEIKENLTQNKDKIIVHNISSNEGTQKKENYSYYFHKRLNKSFFERGLLPIEQKKKYPQKLSDEKIRRIEDGIKKKIEILLE